MRDLEHARLMLRLARDDLAAMEVMEPSAKIAPGIFGFHAQQAVEKALKAWLSLLGVEYPRTHVLYDLFSLLDSHGAATARRFRHLQTLTPFGVQFRYEATVQKTWRKTKWFEKHILARIDVISSNNPPEIQSAAHMFCGVRL
jgi:hypothetical protein